VFSIGTEALGVGCAAKFAAAACGTPATAGLTVTVRTGATAGASVRLGAGEGCSIGATSVLTPFCVSESSTAKSANSAGVNVLPSGAGKALAPVCLAEKSKTNNPTITAALTIPTFSRVKHASLITLKIPGPFVNRASST
jgi:hypothetical protein